MTTTTHPNTFGAQATLTSGSKTVSYFALSALKDHDLTRLPFSLRILLENLLRHEDGRTVTADDIKFLAAWDAKAEPSKEIAYMPARVLMQDFTGVPAIVDLAAMRDAMRALGGNPEKINPLQPAELVIDHSVQVDEFGTADAYDLNAALEFQRNRERYAFLKWGQSAFNNFSAVPPGMGICHQVNLEYLARVVFTTADNVAYPDTLVGTDSHTTMVNGLGVLGWGVGGIEAEAAMLGQPVSMLVPQVVGYKLTGKLREGTTATDLVLTVTEALRKLGVVGKFVEFYGPGISELPLADRATIANMAPEYGATCGIFPVDKETLNYLRLTGRDEAAIQLVEDYMRAQGMFHTADAPEAIYSATIELDLATVEPSVAGPKRPQDRVLLSGAAASFQQQLPNLMGTSANKAALRQMVRWEGEGGHASITGDVTSDVGTPAPGTPGNLPIESNMVPVATLTAGPSTVVVEAPITSVQGRYGVDPDKYLHNGSIVIAAITSCTNTSNPYVMMAAGLLAKKAVEKGLRTPPWVKTSLAPGSRVVTDYYNKAGLMQYLEALRFQVVGYGCTTCIGNSGPLPTDVSKSIEEHNLVAVSVLSGNRNFEGRISPEVRANYLMSPPLVVAYALVGTINHDFATDAIGYDHAKQPVYLRDIWPTQQEVSDAVHTSIGAEMFIKQYSTVSDGDQNWQNLTFPSGDTYGWEPDSTYIRKAPYFDGMPATPAPVEDITRRALPRRPGRLRHDRPHLPRRLHQAERPGRQVPRRAWRQPRRLQQLRLAPRQPRGHGARHLRQRPPAQQDGPGHRGRRHPPAPRTHADVHLRRVGRVRAPRHAARHPGRQGIRLRLVARLGRQRPAPARHPLRHRGVLRAHPPLQPRRHGHPAAAVPARRISRDARPDGRGDLPHRRPQGHARHEVRRRQKPHREGRKHDRHHDGIPRHGPHRHPAGNPLLPARRHPAVRPPPVGRYRLTALQAYKPAGYSRRRALLWAQHHTCPSKIPHLRRASFIYSITVEVSSFDLEEE